MKNYKQLREHYLLCLGKLPELGSMGKCDKRRRVRSRAIRFASCQARKDVNVFRSSKGMFESVENLNKGIRSRPGTNKEKA